MNLYFPSFRLVVKLLLVSEIVNLGTVHRAILISEVNRQQLVPKGTTHVFKRRGHIDATVLSMVCLFLLVASCL